ncbi:MAG: hypothetical protein ACFB0D_15300 [Phormidesmis sp.]
MNTQNFLVHNFFETGLSSGVSTLPELSTLPSLSPAEGEPLRHILLGTPGGVRQTIHLLHTLRYVENALWSPLLPIPEGQLIITPKQGEVMSLLIKNVN